MPPFSLSCFFPLDTNQRYRAVKMPEIHGITTRIIDSSGESLPEYGFRRSGKEASCYIESRTDTTFRVSFMPDHLCVQENSPWQLLATMYLDGRKKPERTRIVYLSTSHRYFNHKQEGKVVLSGRPIRDDKGNMCRYQWVFKEIGIDTMLEDLSLASDDTEQTVQEALASMSSDLGATSLEAKEDPARAGTIKITFERVTVSERPEETTDYVLGCDGDSGSAVNRSGSNISHQTTRTGGKIIGKKIKAIEFERLEDGLVSTITFFYRSEEVLRKFNFRGFPSKTTEGTVPTPSCMMTLPIPSRKRKTREEVAGVEKEKEKTKKVKEDEQIVSHTSFASTFRRRQSN